MDLMYWDTSLPVAQRQSLVAMQVGDTLNRSRQDRTAADAIPESDVVPILRWLSSQKDAELGICAMILAAYGKLDRTTATDLIAKASSVYDFVNEQAVTPKKHKGPASANAPGSLVSKARRLGPRPDRDNAPDTSA